MEDIPTVRDFMTRKVISLKPEQTIGDAINTFVQNRISGAPVIDEAGELVGILSQRDCLSWLANLRYYGVAAGTVADFMSKGVHSIEAAADIFVAADLFLYHHFRRVPVLDGDEDVVGILSRHDVMRAGARLCRSQLEEAPDPGYIPEQLKARLGRDGVPHLTRARKNGE